MKDMVIKVTNWVKRHDNVFCLIIVFLSIYGIILNTKIESSDELWNLQNTCKLYNGFQIYKEVNIIVTPLFFWIGNFIFQMLNANYLSFRIYNIIIIMAFYFVTYLMLKGIGIRKKVSVIITLFLISFKNYYLILGEANYNVLALLFCLIGILLLIKKNKYNSVLQGIILFLILATKQNIGVLYAIGLFGYIMSNKNIILKDKIKICAIQYSITIISILLMMCCFYHMNVLNEFVSFAVLGIREFALQNIYFGISDTIIMLALILINIMLTYSFEKYKKVTDIECENLRILQCFSIMLVFIGVPILNEMHFIYSSYLLIILFIYQIQIMLKNIQFNINTKTINIIFYLFIGFLVINSSYNFYKWFSYINSKNYNIDKDSPFYGGIMTQDLRDSIDDVEKYIKSSKNNVIILSDRAALYMTEMKRNNGIFDLPFKGNLGKEGENGLLEKIKNLHNTEILIQKEDDAVTWQESMIVREYIKNNFEKIGEIREFNIYAVR